MKVTGLVLLALVMSACTNESVQTDKRTPVPQELNWVISTLPNMLTEQTVSKPLTSGDTYLESFDKDSRVYVMRIVNETDHDYIVYPQSLAVIYQKCQQVRADYTLDSEIEALDLTFLSAEPAKVNNVVLNANMFSYFIALNFIQSNDLENFETSNYMNRVGLALAEAAHLGGLGYNDYSLLAQASNLDQVSLSDYTKTLGVRLSNQGIYRLPIEIDNKEISK